MKCSLLLCLRCGILCLALILCFVPASAQEKISRPSQPINLDRALEEQVPADRAASYYHYSLSKWSEDQGDLPKALSEMHAALKYNPDSAAIRLELASLLEKSGNLREAIEYAQEAVRLDPKDPDPHWLLANIYFKSQGQGAAAAENMKKAIQELELLKGLTPDDERIFSALGWAYFEMDEPEKAIQSYEKYQSLSPDGDSGYREIAKYYDREGNTEKALEYLNKGLKTWPDSAESLYMLGSIYARQGKHKEAIPVFKKFLEVAGNNPNVTRRLAASLVEAGEYGEAARLLEDLIKAAPKDRDSQVLLGRSLIARREFPRAVETLQSVVALNPEDLEAQFYLASAYEQSGRPAQAAKIFARLLEITTSANEEGQANRIVFQQHLAANYQEMGENEKAIAIYQELAKSDPKFSPQLANAYRVDRQFDKALALGKQLYEKDPSDIHTAVIYARTLADANKAREGAEILSRLLQSNPMNVDIYVNLSQVYLQDKKYGDAEKILLRAEEKKLENESDKERLKFQRATVYEKQKDFDRAESLFREILQANPDNAVALNYIGYMLADRGVRLEEALKYVQGALAIDPHNGAYLDSLGWAFFKLNDMENAEKYLLQADELVKNDPIIDEHLGDLYFKTGDFTKAQDYWKRSVNIGTEPEDIQKVRQKLEKLQEMIQRQKSAK